jgi:predicted site-specific integrase-resolvase
MPTLSSARPTELPLHDTVDAFTAARIASVSPATIRRWCEDGRVGAWKLVGRWRVDRAGLYSLISQAHNGTR